jgi:thioredoxin-related protein
MLRSPLLLLFLGFFTCHLLAVDTHLLPQAKDLRQLGNSAVERQIPILLMVSQYHCGFCEQMKREVLYPMQLSGEYSNKVIMRELLIDPGEMVTNFQGQRESADACSDRYQVHVTPTLLFLDPKGNEVAERILGINTVDYLLFYIEEAIDTASDTMIREGNP